MLLLSLVPRWFKFEISAEHWGSTVRRLLLLAICVNPFNGDDQSQIWKKLLLVHHDWVDSKSATGLKWRVRVRAAKATVGDGKFLLLPSSCTKFDTSPIVSISMPFTTIRFKSPTNQIACNRGVAKTWASNSFGGRISRSLFLQPSYNFFSRIAFHFKRRKKYPLITYHWTVPLILDHSKLVGRLTSFKNCWYKSVRF